MKNKKVMVFGVFDGLHDGHKYFLNEAARHGKVMAVVARDESIVALKNKKPTLNEEERLHAVKSHPSVAKAVLGDEVLGSYEVVKRYKPDVICFGYDQGDFKSDLEEKLKNKILPSTELLQLSSYRPHKFHSSLL